MQQYRSYTMVWAQKVLYIELDPKGSGAAYLYPGSIYVNKLYMEMHRPEVGGYYVKCEDGHDTFFPADIFESQFTLSTEWGHVIPVLNPIFTHEYTTVLGGNISDKDETETVFHDFMVVAGENGQIFDRNISKVLGEVHFQKGPTKECGVNGIADEDLLLMVITRLQQFQNSPYACRENALALTKLEEAAMWLRKRTLDREARNVEGTHAV